MKDSLFKLNTKLPKHVGHIPMYKTFHFDTASIRNKDFADYISKRVDFLRSNFKTEGELEDVGDQLVIKNYKEALEIYTASDSFWWTDRENAYSENPKLAENLPNKDEAIQNAERLLEKLKIDTQFIKLHSVSNTIAASSKSPKDEKGEQFPTSVNVNFNYELDGLPLFGSGAKTQVSYINNDQAVEILHFYRTPKQDGKTEVITPEKAVQQVVDNYRFAQLKDSERNTGEITDVTLGYFTASPTDLQRYLVPVYKVKGSVSTPALENYEFNLFVIASTESQDMAKRKGQTNQALETVFN